MKAAVIDRYGPPEVVQIREVPTPVPGPDDQANSECTILVLRWRKHVGVVNLVPAPALC